MNQENNPAPVAIPPPAEHSPVKVFDFKTTERTWVLDYTGWDGVDRSVIFQLEKSFKGLSRNIIHKDLHDGVNVGVFTNDAEGIHGPVLTTMRCDIPDMWPDKNEHEVFNSFEVNELYDIMIREVNGAYFQRLADGWRNYAADKAGAMLFNVNFI